MADGDPAGGANANEPGGETSTIREMRDLLKTERESREADRKEFAEFKRSAMFDKAGIPAEKVGKLFRESYTGELELEAIKAAAIEAGVKEAPKATGDDERETVRRLREAGAGAPFDGEPKLSSEHLEKIKNDPEFADNDVLMKYVDSLGLVIHD